MLTLIMCLFLDFINIQYKKINILLIKRRKRKTYRKSLRKLNHNTSLLNFEDKDRTRG